MPVVSMLRHVVFRAAFAAAFAVAASSSYAQTVVTMWTFLDPAKTSGREVALKNMIDSFEKANPTIKVKVEPQVFSELMAKFLAAHNTGAAPDIIWVNTENMGALMKSGAAADLNELITSKWGSGADADFFVRAGWDASVGGQEARRSAAVPRHHEPLLSQGPPEGGRHRPRVDQDLGPARGSGEEADAGHRQGRPHRRLRLRHAAVERAHRGHHCIHRHARRRRQALDGELQGELRGRRRRARRAVARRHDRQAQRDAEGDHRQSRRRRRRPVHRRPLRHRRDAVRALLAGREPGEVGRRQPRHPAVAELDRRQAGAATGAGMVGGRVVEVEARSGGREVRRVDDQPGFGARVGGDRRAGADAHVRMEGAGDAPAQVRLHAGGGRRLVEVELPRSDSSATPRASTPTGTRRCSAWSSAARRAKEAMQEAEKTFASRQ